MKFWWLSDFARVGDERTAVQKLIDEEGWFALARWRLHESRLCAEGEILVGEVRFPVHLIYPDQFPAVPAWVQPQDPEAQWSVHQFGEGGSLCLELRPDNWSPYACGADVLRSAYNLLRTENPLGTGERQRVQSAHHIGEVQSYSWGDNPLLIGAGCLERIQAGTAISVQGLRWMAADEVWPILIFDAADLAGSFRPPAADINTWRFDVQVLAAHGEPPANAPETRVALASALGLDLGTDALAKSALVAVAVGSQRTVAYHSPSPEKVYVRKWVVLPDHAGLRSARTPAAAAKQIALVGVGSIGSKIAEALLRSGVTRLLLVDGDVFLPGNLERHTLEWRDVGFRKAHAVKRRLLNIAPGADITVIDENLNWQRSARVHALQIDVIASCDLIVDATGDPPTGLLLGAIAADNEKHFVSAVVFEGGFGGLVARSVHGRDPPYVHGRAAYHAYCEARGVPTPTAGAGNYEALSDAGAPIVADDASASLIAAYAGRVILDTLDDALGQHDVAWLLIGCCKSWLFEGLGHTIQLDVGPPPPPLTPQENPEAQAFVLSLLQGHANAAASAG